MTHEPSRNVGGEEESADRIECDVLVVGSGAGGLLAAARAHDLGLQVCVIEKADRYGGTSAVSGGAIWIPNNAGLGETDSPEEALDYLRACTGGAVADDKLEAYIGDGPTVVRYLKELGVEYYSAPYPDYRQHLSGSMVGGRTMFVRPVDGKQLGKDFFYERESAVGMKLFGRIAVDSSEAIPIVTRARGRWLLLARIISRYWLDIRWRLLTRRDRRVTGGGALIAGLRAALRKRKIPLLLGTRLTQLGRTGERVDSAVVMKNGVESSIHVRQAIVLASGGFEHNQSLRKEHLPAPTSSSWSVTPVGANTGDALLASTAIGADVEFLGEAWWAPTIRLPARTLPNVDSRFALFMERQYPHGICVNRLGERFTNEGLSYNDFVQAMLADNEATGANSPCWLVFDARFRRRYALGGLLPGLVEPDAKLPAEWWDNVLYRAETLGELASKIKLPAETLQRTISRFNGFAATGIDEDFGRGSSAYDRRFADPRCKPNPGLGALEESPFYAIRLDAGDIGTKGGAKIDAHARVVSTSGTPIPGLYAVGNCSGAVTGSAYPGAGATLGSAVIFAYRAAAHIAIGRTGAE